MHVNCITRKNLINLDIQFQFVSIWTILNVCLNTQILKYTPLSNCMYKLCIYIYSMPLRNSTFTYVYIIIHVYIYGNLTSNSVLHKYQSINISSTVPLLLNSSLKKLLWSNWIQRQALCLFKSLAIYLYDCIVLLIAKKSCISVACSKTVLKLLI